MTEHLEETTAEQEVFSAFIDPDDTVSVSDDKGNTINIRVKMSLRVRGKVQRELASYSTSINEDGQVDQSKIEIRTAPQLSRLAMFQANIVSWNGNAFRKQKKDGSLGALVKVTPQAIARLDPDWDLLDKVYKTLNELNAGPGTPEEGDTGSPT